MSLHSHLKNPPNLSEMSDEHRGRLYQDILVMVTGYQGHFNPNIIDDYYWFRQRDTSTSVNVSNLNTIDELPSSVYVIIIIIIIMSSSYHRYP